MFKSRLMFDSLTLDTNSDRSYLGLSDITGKRHCSQWLGQIKDALVKGDCAALAQLFNEWEQPSLICLNLPDFKIYNEWKDIDPFNVVPSSWLHCLNKTNESRGEGQRIRCFVGEGIDFEACLSFPLCKNSRPLKSAFAIRHWVALDGGPDYHPNSLPTRSSCSLHNSRPMMDYGILLVLIRAQDLPFMYSEEANARALFPNVTLHNLTSLVLANGTESNHIRDLIREQLKTSNALMAAQLISVDCPSSVQFLLHELGTLAERDVIPFILRRLEYQCSFKEDLPATQELKESIAKSWKAYLDGLTTGDWAHKTEIFSFREDLVRIQLQSLQRVPSAHRKSNKVILGVIIAFPDHAEFLGIVYAILNSINAEISIPVLENLISDLASPQPNEPFRDVRRTLLNLLWKNLNRCRDQNLLKTRFVGLILVSNEVEDLALFTEVTQRLLLEGSHQCHVACEMLVKSQMSSAMSPFYLNREKEIRDSIRAIEEKQEFNGTYMRPKIPLHIKPKHRDSLKQFLEGAQETIQLTGLNPQEGLELSNILSWKHPKWCRFDQPSDHCEENEGFSVTCRIVPLEGGAIAVEVTKTDTHFLHERKNLSELEEELAWLLLRHNSKKRPLPPSWPSSDSKISKSTPSAQCQA